MTTLFFDLCPGPIVGVTGSSGKTTTTGLIGQILRCDGRDVVVGGNIGDPMLDLLPRIGPNTIVVLELSSFQLSILRCSPHIAVVTNITPNHLDRHKTMEAYIAAKRHIVEHQSAEDFAVLNRDDEEVRRLGAGTPAPLRWFGLQTPVCDGATVMNGSVGLMANRQFLAVLPVEQIPLLGRHNVENVLAAMAATSLLEVDPAAMARAVTTFHPAAHRLQTVGSHRGVHYVDDSIATSPARAVVALQAIESPVVLIAGGRDKHLPWDDFAEMVLRKTRALFLIGEAAPLIESTVCRKLQGSVGPLDAPAIKRCGSLEEAVAEASAAAEPGDVVLLSPGCTSYDMFTDFAERGDVFARAVEQLDAA